MQLRIDATPTPSFSHVATMAVAWIERSLHALPAIRPAAARCLGHGIASGSGARLLQLRKGLTPIHVPVGLSRQANLFRSHSGAYFIWNFILCLSTFDATRSRVSDNAVPAKLMVCCSKQPPPIHPSSHPCGPNFPFLFSRTTMQDYHGS